MKYIQNIALSWHSTFDNNSFILNNLKVLNKNVRFAFYIFLILAFYISLVFFKNYGLSFIDNAPFKIILDSFLSFIIYVVTFATSLIVSYESIIDVDSDALIKAKKDKKQYIKDNKLQKWRLRNMNIFFRILIYLLVYFILVQMSMFFGVNGFMSEFGAGATQEQFNSFIASFDNFIKYFTFVYVIIVLFIDYRVKK